MSRREPRPGEDISQDTGQDIVEGFGEDEVVEIEAATGLLTPEEVREAQGRGQPEDEDEDQHEGWEHEGWEPA